ncbi:WxL domain-containing protein [Enterococcus sp. LJL128]|uniref:WxL domain-containing protein n=1 Tax=Enterococcus sp. LJL51 TaxID=3416656 RepID=UPI003CFB9160
MKIIKNIYYCSFLFLLLLSSATTGKLEALAEENIGKTDGRVEVIGDIPKEPIDPEIPINPVDPGPGPSTDGDLRFDFVSAFNLGRNKITYEKERLYHVNAQLFHDGTPARGNYVQITDQRSGSKGWSLQVRQEHQFQNDVIQKQEEKELRGAVFSLDNGWANSPFSAEKAPEVTRDTIEINEIGITYNVAVATPGSGKGTWTIEFGASENNSNGQMNTLFPKTNEDGSAVLDTAFENQQVYGNKAVSLSVPMTTKLYPVQYQTVLTWILAELP